MFRTLILRQCSTVGVYKLADIVTSLWLVNQTESFKQDTCIWNHLIISYLE